MMQSFAVDSGYYENEYHGEVWIKICDICHECDDSDRPDWGKIDMSYRDNYGHNVKKHLDVCKHCRENSQVYRMLTE